MISHRHKCIFIHIPKTAGKSILALFGLPEYGRDYTHPFSYIEDPYDHVRLAKYQDKHYFGGYFKFAFTRNPWDRLVSMFFYLNAGGSNQWDESFRLRHLAKYGQDFGYFVRELASLLHTKYFLPQCVWICDSGGNMLTDFVGRFERLRADLAVVEERTNISPSVLPHRNQSDHRPYAEYYDLKSREIVARLYAADIAYFGYDFD